ncbi:hypothetical protein LSUE1_G007913 [Lachnellula suecica]|uniref:Uncharacterized protein n=1 Tax=Lachnellula suecica TaxID=602035 RepID=A0A8T9BY63_9HELO|nr:hypothetical protein LSUE1_G007913 [Lachnellula suecica]
MISNTASNRIIKIILHILIWSIAIWDNRSIYYAATYDYNNNGLCTGQRCVGIGERLYFDPVSKSKCEAEGEEYMEPGEGFTVF